MIFLLLFLWIISISALSYWTINFTWSHFSMLSEGSLGESAICYCAGKTVFPILLFFFMMSLCQSLCSVCTLKETSTFSRLTVCWGKGCWTGKFLPSVCVQTSSIWVRQMEVLVNLWSLLSEGGRCLQSDYVQSCKRHWDLQKFSSFKF